MAFVYNLDSSTKYSSSGKTVKTEREYLPYTVDYSKYFVKYDTSTPDYIKLDLKSQGDIEKEASEHYKDLYNTYIDNTIKERDYSLSLLGDALQGVDPLYDQKVNTIKEAYALNSQALTNSTLSKGMGRSSYAMDLQQENIENMSNELNTTNAQRLQEKEDIQKQIQGVNLEQELAQNQYEAQRDYDIRSMSAELISDQNKSMIDAQKYNNDLYESRSKLLLDQYKHNLDVQKYMDSLNTIKQTITTTTTSSTRNVYKREYDAGQTLKEWNSLGTLNERQNFLLINAAVLQEHDKNLYEYFQNENVNYVMDMARNIFK